MKKVFLIGTTLILIGAILFWFTPLFRSEYIVGYKHGKLITRVQLCSDYCPDFNNSKSSWDKYGETVYKGVTTEKECNDVGGKSIFDYAFGGHFWACSAE